MLGLYLDILIIGHKLCSVLSILAEITLQKYYAYINVAGQKNNNKTKKRRTENSLPEPGIEPGTSSTAVWSVNSRLPRQMNVTIEVKLFNCFNVMG